MCLYFSYLCFVYILCVCLLYFYFSFCFLFFFFFVFFFYTIFFFFFFFFFQAEDGIRDLTVTGVQTCALPIYGIVTSVTLSMTVTDMTHPARQEWILLVHLLPQKPTKLRVHVWRRLDRKSTRLNSSHSQISYAVFCLKKKIT